MGETKSLTERLKERKPDLKLTAVKKTKATKKIDTSSMEDFFATALADYAAFDTKAWSKGGGYSLPNYKDIEERLEGLDSGMYLFAGESNSGKTTIMMNLMYDIVSHEENKLYGIYYSLDDSKDEIIARVIAMDELIPIGIVAKPQRYQAKIDEAEENSALYMELLERRNEAIERFKTGGHFFKIEDSTRIRSGDDVLEHMRRMQVYVKAIDPDANIIVGIDSVYDVRFKGLKFSSTEEKNAYTAQQLKEWTVELDIPIFGSCHLRKLNNNRRPVLDDLKNSGEYVYEASVVWLVHNDVSKNKESATVFYSAEEYEEKRPIIEMDWAKNKKSSYKGRSYLFFVPEYSKTSECHWEDAQRYDSLVYEL